MSLSKLHESGFREVRDDAVRRIRTVTESANFIRNPRLRSRVGYFYMKNLLAKEFLKSFVIDRNIPDR